MPKERGNGTQSSQCDGSTPGPTPGSSADDSNVDGGSDSVRVALGYVSISAFLSFPETADIAAFFTLVGDEDAGLLSRAWLDNITNSEI